MEKMNSKEVLSAALTRNSNFGEEMNIKGHYVVKCHDKDGNLKWEDEIHNLVVNVGKDLTLDTILAGSAYTVTGPFMGILTAAGAPSFNATDTMSSHAGWLECGPTNAPDYTGNRATLTFSAASGGSKSLSANATFPILASGTVKGAFVVLGSGAVNTKDSTAGTLFSAGAFSGGDKAVGNGDTLSVSYTVSL